MIWVKTYYISRLMYLRIIPTEWRSFSHSLKFSNFIWLILLGIIYASFKETPTKSKETKIYYILQWRIFVKWNKLRKSIVHFRTYTVCVILWSLVLSMINIKDIQLGKHALKLFPFGRNGPLREHLKNSRLRTSILESFKLHNTHFNKYAESKHNRQIIIS